MIVQLFPDPGADSTIWASERSLSDNRFWPILAKICTTNAAAAGVRNENWIRTEPFAPLGGVCSVTMHDPVLLTEVLPVRSASRTDDEDFQRFYREDGRRLAGALALALGDVDLANEAVDEGMARAYQRWRKVRSYNSPAGWVYRVSMNWARNRIRNRRRETLTDEIVDYGAADQFTSRLHPADSSNIDTDVDAALNSLSFEARSVVVLRYLLGWSTAETAQALGIASGTVKSRLSRALQQLESLLEQQ